MTVKERMIEILVKNGMEEADAVELMNEVARNDEPFYGHPAETYEDVYYSAWFFAVKRVVLVWIDKNKPKAAYRHKFDISKITQ